MAKRKFHIFLSSIFSILLLCNIPTIVLTQNVEEKDKLNLLDYENRLNTKSKIYILGPGDQLEIKFLGASDFNALYEVGPDGTINLPRLKKVNVEGLSIDELNTLLTYGYKDYIRETEITIDVQKYRPVNFIVDGEIKRPGYYTLERGSNNKKITLFDVIKAANGVTPTTNLEKVIVQRKNPISQGGGYKEDQVNFLSLLMDGLNDNNIEILDGDLIKLTKSKTLAKDQLLKAIISNLSPDKLDVFVSGNVTTPGVITVPQGSSLNQAIIVAGGPLIFKGKIEFIRLNRDTNIESRLFEQKPNAKINSYENPVLMSGDIIRVKRSVLGTATEVIDRISRPLIGIYTINQLFSRN